MKTGEEVLKIIDSKIKEHTQIVSEVDKVFQKLVLERDALKAKDPKSPELVTVSLKIMTLRDRIGFHKACVSILNDLTESIK